VRNCTEEFVAACEGPEADVTGLEWLSAFLTEADNHLGAIIQQVDDPQALYHAYSESCRLLRNLTGAYQKAMKE
jgi:hypothetical protein